jgi:ATP:ADP antiporter, AAA family
MATTSAYSVAPSEPVTSKVDEASVGGSTGNPATDQVAWHTISSTEALEGNNGGDKGAHSPSRPQQSEDDDFYEVDAFLDRPQSSKGQLLRFSTMVRTSTPFSTCGALVRMSIRCLYGDTLPMSEMLRALCLATTLFLIATSHTLLFNQKYSILATLCGWPVIHMAQAGEVDVMILVILAYNILLNTGIAKFQIVYILCMFFYALFLIIGLLLMHPLLGLPNQIPSPGRILGYVSFYSIDSFRWALPSLFWSFANSNLSLETAKGCYGLVAAANLLGTLAAPALVNIAAPQLDTLPNYLLGTFSVLLPPLSMYWYISLYGALDGDNATRLTSTCCPPRKVCDCCSWIVNRWKRLCRLRYYIVGLYATNNLGLVGISLLDAGMKELAQRHFADKYPYTYISSFTSFGAPSMSPKAESAFWEYITLFGSRTNLLELVMFIFGSSVIVRKLGIQQALLLYPALMLVCFIVVYFYPTLQAATGALMVLKTCFFALNKPTHEILYQPTSATIRYNYRMRVEVLGSVVCAVLGRSLASATAATNSHGGAPAFSTARLLVGIIFALFLMGNAYFMGQKFEEHMASGFVVRDEDDWDRSAASDSTTTNGEGATTLEMTGRYTSCSTVEEKLVVTGNSSV